MKIIMIFILLISTAILSKESIAQDCRGYEATIENYQNLRRKGGSARQMTLWQNKINHYKDLYQDCKRSGGSTGTVDKIKRSPPRNNYSDYRDKRTSNINNHQLQQLIKTCNYWINQHNHSPSWDNRNLRDTACRAANEKERAIRNPIPKAKPHVRSVNDCIKPNNVLDDEVKDCIQGKIDPYWRREEKTS